MTLQEDVTNIAYRHHVIHSMEKSPSLPIDTEHEELFSGKEGKSNEFSIFGTEYSRNDLE